MAFEKIKFAMKTWKDKVSGGTPITAAELNRIEKGISDTAKGVNDLGDSVSLINETAGVKDFDQILYNSILTLQCDKATNAPYKTGWVTIWTQRIANNLDYFSQMAITVNTAPKVFIRARFGGEWGEWRGL